MASEAESIKTGWAQADITPDQNVLLAGQFHARVSEGIMDPLTATALAIEAVNGDCSSGQMVMVSCDLATISDELRDAVRARIKSELSGLSPINLLIGATHAHSAPEVRMAPYTCDPSVSGSEYGIWPPIGFDAITPAAYVEFAAGRIAGAVKAAWEKRGAAGIAYGMGHAVIGRNRRLVYQDDASVMYGRANIPEFRHVEGYEDHSVQAMMTYDRDKNLTGMIVNVPCPAQVSEQIYKISADYWHETREELRKRFGRDLFILAQCAPAGDQSPHVLIGKRAEERMWRLKGRDTDQNAPREEIALKIAGAVSDIAPYAEKEIDWNPKFEHKSEILELPRRMISERDVEETLEEARPFREEYKKLADAIWRNPEIRKKTRWYINVTNAYRRMERSEQVKKRFELQKNNPSLPIVTHVARVGDVAFATNPFELFLDYAVRIRELSKATQTFLIQKAGCNGTYLPSKRSIAHKGYGSVPASTDIGPEGGEKLVDWTAATINGMFI